MKKTAWHSSFGKQKIEGDMTRRWIQWRRLISFVVLPVAEQNSVVNVQFNIYRFVCSFLELWSVMYGAFPASPCTIHKSIKCYFSCVQDVPLRRAKVRISLWATSLLQISGIMTWNYERLYCTCYGFQYFLEWFFFFSALQFTAVGQSATVVSCRLEVGVYTE